MNANQQLTDEQIDRLQRIIDGFVARFMTQLAVPTANVEESLARMERYLSDFHPQTQGDESETTAAPFVDTWRETVHKKNVERAVERVIPRISILRGPVRW